MHHIFYGVCYLTITICKAFEPSWAHQVEVTGYGTLSTVCFVAAAHTWTHAALTRRRKAKAEACGDDAAIVNAVSPSPDVAD